MLQIGVLALQGSFHEHLSRLYRMDGVVARAVKSAEDLNAIDGLILPGGESTTLGKLLRIFDLDEAIKDRAAAGMPIWGTCAGMILMAGEVVGEETVPLGLMDIAVRRNAFGGQLESFRCALDVPEVSSEPVEAVFIRAPWIEQVKGDARSLAEHDGKIVAARQGNLLVTSFHPELTEDGAFYRYFLRMIG